jgi:prepilin-type N-terminal cleavage/methylation domain-containing protein
MTLRATHSACLYRRNLSLATRCRHSSTPSQPNSGFTLIELLVATAIIAMLLALVGAAVSAARSNQKVDNTRRLIAKLDAILSEQLSRYDSMSVDVSAAPSAETRGAYRSWFIRRNLISGDLPDRWSDVAYLGSGAGGFPRTPHQKTYAAIWNTLSAGDRTQVAESYAGAECLFMIVMMGGIADCLDCGDLKTAEIGDVDGDGFNEFLDDWGNPIGFILWPCGVELPAGSGEKFFANSRVLDPPFNGYPRPSLGMKPLIYSAGPDGEYGFDRRSEACTLSAESGGSPVFGPGRDCGDHSSQAFMAAGGLNLVDGGDVRGDNITNLDEEAKR